MLLALLLTVLCATPLADAAPGAPRGAGGRSTTTRPAGVPVAAPSSCATGTPLGVGVDPASYPAAVASVLSTNTLGAGVYRVWIRMGDLPFAGVSSNSYAPGAVDFSRVEWKGTDTRLRKLLRGGACLVLELALYAGDSKPLREDISRISDTDQRTWTNLLADYGSFVTAFLTQWRQFDGSARVNLETINEPNISLGHIGAVNGKVAGVPVEGAPPILEADLISELAHADQASGLDAPIWGPVLADTTDMPTQPQQCSSWKDAHGNLHLTRFNAGASLSPIGMPTYVYDSHCYLRDLEGLGPDYLGPLQQAMTRDIMALDVHIYAQPGVGVLDPWLYTRPLREYALDLRVRRLSLPITVSEFGFEVASGGNGAVSTDANQARDIVNATAAILAGGAKAAILWDWDDQGGVYGLVSGFPDTRPVAWNGKPPVPAHYFRPAFVAYQVAIHELQGATNWRGVRDGGWPGLCPSAWLAQQASGLFVLTGWAVYHCGAVIWPAGYVVIGALDAYGKPISAPAPLAGQHVYLARGKSEGKNTPVYWILRPSVINAPMRSTVHPRSPAPAA